MAWKCRESGGSINIILNVQYSVWAHIEVRPYLIIGPSLLKSLDDLPFDL
jgi:hypothetical protein